MLPSNGYNALQVPNAGASKYSGKSVSGSDVCDVLMPDSGLFEYLPKRQHFINTKTNSNAQFSNISQPVQF